MSDPLTSGGSRISRRGDVDLVGGVWTPEAVTFQKFCMSKRKNWDPQRACAGHAPLDPPMLMAINKRIPPLMEGKIWLAHRFLVRYINVINLNLTACRKSTVEIFLSNPF